MIFITKNRAKLRNSISLFILRAYIPHRIVIFLIFIISLNSFSLELSVPAGYWIVGNDIYWFGDLENNTTSTGGFIAVTNLNNNLTQEVDTGPNCNNAPGDIGNLYVDNENLYLVKQSSNTRCINKTLLSGGISEQIYSVETSPIIGMVAQGNYLYWLESEIAAGHSNGSLKRIPLGGGEVEILSAGLKEVQLRPFISNGQIFFADGLNVNNVNSRRTRIMSVPTGGGTTSVLVDYSGGYIKYMDIDDSFVYWWDNGGSLNKIPQQGGTIATLSSESLITSIATGSNNVFFGDGDFIKQISKNGGLVSNLVSTTLSSGATKMSAQSGNIFWLENNSLTSQFPVGKILSIPEDGGTVITVVESPNDADNDGIPDSNDADDDDDGTPDDQDIYPLDATRQSALVEEFYPLQSGNQWTYLLNGSTSWTETILSGTSNVNNVVTKIRRDPGGDVYLTNDANGWRQHQQILNDGTTIVYAPPIKGAESEVSLGQHISNNGTETITFPGNSPIVITYSLTSDIAALENITVPLGNFQAVKVNVSINFGSPVNGTENFTYWFVKNIGIVKSINEFDGITDTLELTAILIDPDNDGVNILSDNCPGIANHNQLDTDGDGEGNSCDLDDDNDGLSDIDETQLGTNPLLADSDNDSLSDLEEVEIGTNPLSPDSDNDGLTDNEEVDQGRNPLVNESIIIQILNNIDD